MKRKKVYAHPVRPEHYPAFLERMAKAVTKAALGDRIQFVCNRGFLIDKQTNLIINYQEDLEMYSETLKLGKIMWPYYQCLYADNFNDVVDEVKRRGLYLFDFWGFVPGTPRPSPAHPWGEYTIPDHVKTYLDNVLGDHFLGFDNGEQDGRYAGAYAPNKMPVVLDKKHQYQCFQAHFEKLCGEMKQYTTVLSSLTFLHYFAKEGNAIMLGAETAQALPNSQMWFAFIRGASKQYGLLHYGNASVWNRWGYKSYESSGHEANVEWGDESGTSVSLLRRLMYSQYMYNCSILGFEQSWIYGENSESRIKGEITPLDLDKSNPRLTPVGKIQQSANMFFEKYGEPGVMYTPFAIVADFFAGWVPPRHLYTQAVYKTWGALPYQSGDYQIHSLFSMLFPGYENAGFFKDERGFLTSTPFGELCDVLLNDAPVEILMQYNTLFITNSTSITYEFFDKLKKYVENGGDIIIFAGAIAEYYNSLEQQRSDCMELFGIKRLGTLCEEKDAVVRGDAFSKSFVIPECSFYDADWIDHSQILATVNEKPFIVKSQHGNGSVTVLMTKDGLSCLNESPIADNNLNRDIEHPFDYNECIKDYFANIFNDMSIIRPDNRELQYCVNVKDKFNLTILISNNTNQNQSFNIVGGEYNIINITELEIDDGVLNCVDFLKKEFITETTVGHAGGKYVIEPGDTKIFSIELGDQALSLSDELVPKKLRDNLYLGITADTIKEWLLYNPTFKDYFSGLMISAEYFRKVDLGFARKESEYVRNHKVDIIVDFTPLLDHYPNFSAANYIQERYENMLGEIRSIFKKASLYGCNKAIFTITKGIEGWREAGRMEKGYINAFNDIVHIAKALSIEIIIQNRPIFMRTESAYDMVLEKVEDARIALNISGALCGGYDCERLCDEYKFRGIFLASYEKDCFGQAYNSPVPIKGSANEMLIKKIYDKECIDNNNFAVLNAIYRSWDEIYADVKLLLGI